MLIRESLLRRLIREEARRILQEDDDSRTTTWEDGAYKYSYNPDTDTMYLLSGPKVTAPRLLKSNVPADVGWYDSILKQYQDKMGLPRTAPTTVKTDVTPPGEIAAMIQRRFARMNGFIQSSYQARLKQIPDLKGAWKISFVIKPDGSVKNAKAIGQNVSDPALEADIVKIVTATTFDPIAQDQLVNKTITLSPTY